MKPSDALVSFVAQFVTSTEEMKWLNVCRHEQPAPHSIDLLEVYASDTSRLTSEVIRQGGRAKRFTKEDGDLSTFEGQCKLLKMIFRYRPKHVWLAPECAPWCPWNRFNQGRSIQAWNRVSELQEQSRTHLRLCALILRIQMNLNGHFHLENPLTSALWNQPEIQPICNQTAVARFDQCRFDLRHPETQELIQKSTRVQSSSNAVIQKLDQKVCHRDHYHTQLKGKCVVKGISMNATRYAAFYPRRMAQQIASAMLYPSDSYANVCQVDISDWTAEGHIDCEIFHSEELKVETATKRARKETPTKKREVEDGNAETENKRSKIGDNEGDKDDDDKDPSSGSKDKPVGDDSEALPSSEVNQEIDDPEWKGIFDQLRQELPKSGVVRWEGSEGLLPLIRAKCLDFEIQSVMTGKGRERYIIHPDRLPYRKTIIQSRFNYKIHDLGIEHIEQKSRNALGRKARSSHIMICIFGRPKSGDELSFDRMIDELKSPVVGSKKDLAVPSRNAEPLEMDPTSWTPAAVSQSGPAFRRLSQSDQAMIRKLHKNLGHPTSEKLANHLANQKARSEIVEGARDYLCSSCVERRPPKLNPPGQLKDRMEFNTKVWIDGFEWTSQSGLKVYVLHFIDDATQFHLGRRTIRDSDQAQRVMDECWMSWAGAPEEVVLDCGGEFVSERWKTFLQREGIRTLLTATPWQRGKIERHGGIIKEMLSRIDNDEHINTEASLDRALAQCFRAKNSLATVKGFSPEQAVLGKATRIPASLMSDEDMPSHLLAAGSCRDSIAFQAALRIRTLAQKAFFDCDTSQSIRRALLRKSRGEITEWQNGQPCMFWDKRKSPNMLEKGRWCGPAQVVLVESKTIVWITHMNRLLRCARDNLRPVSLREFASRERFSQHVEKEKLEELSRTLQRNLRERSGMFQFSDLSEVPPEDPRNQEEVDPNHGQPEEEPVRRISTDSQPSGPLEAHEIPLPDGHAPFPPTPNNSEYAPTSEEENTGEVIGESSQVTGESGMPEGDIQAPEVANVTEVIFNAKIIESNDTGPYIHSEKDTLWSESIDPAFDACQFEFTVPVQLAERWFQDPTIYDVNIASAARKAKNEVQYSKLTAEEKLAFKKAKEKELKCWLGTSTVTRMLRNRIHPDRILSSRWILTYKPDPSQPKGYKHKARLVVRGFQDPEIDKVSTDSPTLTRDGRMILLQIVSSSNWTVQSFDITTAFLRGKGDGRQLAVDPVPELRDMMGLKDSEICLLEGNAYGRVDAPLLFYKEFRSQLEKVGFEAHPLDSCLYLLRNPVTGNLDGILGTHVDDGIGGGNARFDQVVRELSKVLPFGSHEKQKFKFTGLDIEQLPDFSIRINQGEFIEKIPPIDIPKIRRSERESMANPHEVQQLRALCGSLQYAAVNSRPDLAAKVSMVQKSICKATVESLLEGNRVLSEAKNTESTSITIRPIPLKEITFASFGDASFASASQLKAQQGLFIMACTKRLAQNESTDFSPVAWNSKQIGRVVRSTLSAEAYAMSSSLDKLNWIRCLWGFAIDKTFEWQHPERALRKLPKALLITDCRSLYDLVTKLAVPNCQEWRTTIEVMLIKQQSEGNAECRWISTAIMLADCLTKSMDATFLRQVLQLGRFRIFDSEKELHNNPHKKVATRWIQKVGALEPEQTQLLNIASTKSNPKSLRCTSNY